MLNSSPICSDNFLIIAIILILFIFLNHVEGQLFCCYFALCLANTEFIMLKQLFVYVTGNRVVMAQIKPRK